MVFILQMGRIYHRQPGARAYISYSSEILRKALEEVQNNRLSLRKASRKYKIPLGTLSHKKNQKHIQAIGHPTAFSIQEEQAFVNHVLLLSEWGFPFDLVDLRKLAHSYLAKVDKKIAVFKNNFPSIDWAIGFLKRHKNQISQRMCQNIKKSRASLSAACVNTYFSNLEKTLTDEDGRQIPPANIYNYDETNVSDNPGVKKCIFKRGVKYPERVRDSTKSCISIMFCGSATGVMIPAYVVYKAENIWST